MTSAPNLLQLSNGNSRMAAFLVATLLLAGCDALQPAANTPTNPRPSDGLAPVVGKNRHPAANNIALAPHTNGSIDTLRWSKPKAGVYPAPMTVGGTSGGTVSPKTDPSPVKPTPVNPNPSQPTDPKTDPTPLSPTDPSRAHKLAVLMPFFADEVSTATAVIPEKTERPLRFYEGMILGFKDLEREGIRLEVSVYDTKRDLGVLSGILQSPDLQATDLIIGPVDVESVRIAAAFSKETQKPMLSLNSTEGIAVANPFYIQSSPSLGAYCEATLRYIKARYPRHNIVLVGRDNGESVRFPMYQQANNALSNFGTNNVQECVISGSSSTYNLNAVKAFLSTQDTTVVIIPSVNANFVYSMLRDLHTIRRTYPMVVFGLPQWAEFDKMEAAQLEMLNVHLPISAFPVASDPAVNTFKTHFFAEYGIAPSEEAFKGYDFATYFGRMLAKYGNNFVNFLEQNPATALHGNISFQKVFSAADGSTEGNYKADYYENRAVHIVRFMNYHFVKMTE